MTTSFDRFDSAERLGDFGDRKAEPMVGVGIVTWVDANSIRTATFELGDGKFSKGAKLTKSSVGESVLEQGANGTRMPNRPTQERRSRANDGYASFHG